jgi:hypothetical protein
MSLSDIINYPYEASGFANLNGDRPAEKKAHNGALAISALPPRRVVPE